MHTQEWEPESVQCTVLGSGRPLRVRYSPLLFKRFKHLEKPTHYGSLSLVKDMSCKFELQVTNEKSLKLYRIQHTCIPDRYNGWLNYVDDVVQVPVYLIIIQERFSYTTKVEISSKIKW